MTERDWQRVREHLVAFQRERDAALLDRVAIERRQAEGSARRGEQHREWNRKGWGPKRLAPYPENQEARG